MTNDTRRLPTPHGVFLTREALALGYDARTIRKLLRQGTWVQVRHGAYCAADLWETLDERGRRCLVADAA